MSSMSSSSSNLTLRRVEERLPAGFRFHPRDEELVCDYLLKWVLRLPHPHHQTPDLMIHVDLNNCEPWDLPESARVGDKEWYFYSQRDRKYSTGTRTNRATISGYWKATGKDRPVFHRTNRQLVGMRKTLVFYQGRAPRGRKTGWVMHEFRLECPLGCSTPPASAAAEDWVLCRVSYKKTSSDQSAGAGGEINQHVPCFSIFSPNQYQMPNSTLIDYNDSSSAPQRVTMSNFSGLTTRLPQLGIYNWDPSSSLSANSCYVENEMTRGAWNNHLLIMPKVNSDSQHGYKDYNNSSGDGLLMKGFPSSFWEGS